MDETNDQTSCQLSLINGDVTSPSQLEEMSLDSMSFSNAIGVRSPTGPLRGRSVKEYEDQLAHLKKENFDLKLRIYFLEERAGFNFNLDKENVVKKNIELSVEVESLRRELQEKQELLCQAVKAMELEDEEQKKLKDDIENLNIQLQNAKAESEETSDKKISNLIETNRLLEQQLYQNKEFVKAIEEKNLKLTTDLLEVRQQLEENQIGDTPDLHRKVEEQRTLIDELTISNQKLGLNLEKEKKKLEKVKMVSDQKIMELQNKLEANVIELQKSQDLVVSNNKSPRLEIRNIDNVSFSVEKSTASCESQQKDAFSFSSNLSPLASPLSSPSPSANFQLGPNTDLKTALEQVTSERNEQHLKIVKLKAEQMKACKIIKSMIQSKAKQDEELMELREKYELLQAHHLSKKKSSSSSRGSSNDLSKENSMDEQNGELIEHYKALTDQLEEKNKLLEATLLEQNNQTKHLQEEFEELKRNYQIMEEHATDLEFELVSKQNSIVNDNQAEDVEEYLRQIKEKDEEIECLNEKLLQRNCDLQGLVNNELWQKNREIEKLQKKQASHLLATKDTEIEKLQNDVRIKEKQLGLIKNKISELGIDIDIDNDEISVENHLKNELEQSEKLRTDATQMCSILSGRLEELALFLDSLLKQKLVLGLLGEKENKRIRQIIDQSLELSKSFTMSMIIHPDQSLLQLSNISNLLSSTQAKEEIIEEMNATRFSIIPGNISLTYTSHLYRKDGGDSAAIIEALRQQVVNLKYELQLRDVELGKMSLEMIEGSSEKEKSQKNLNTTSTTLKYISDNHSESEAWSEPDRTVSRARIGLINESIRSAQSHHTSTDSTEDEHSELSPKSGKRGTRNTIIELHKQVCELDQKLNEKEVAYYETIKINNKLKHEIANLEEKLNDAEQKRSEAELKFIKLEETKDMLLELQIINKEMSNKLNQIEVEKTYALEAVELAKSEVQTAEKKIKSLQIQMCDAEEAATNKLEEKEREWKNAIEEVQEAAELEIKTLHETIQQLHFEYSQNYIKKSQLEDAFDKIERLKRELNILEERIEELNREEQESIRKLLEREDQVNVLRGDLDNATLQYSEAVLEKTKIANEKNLIERDLNNLRLREVDFKRNIDEVRQELQLTKQTYQKQVSSLQDLKSQLEVRISELESSNAELYNKLVKIQTGSGDYMSSSPTTSNFVNQIVSFRRQQSERSPEFRLAESQFEENRNMNRLMLPPNIDLERNEANSSPDLGIESDQGRFSSLETQLNTIQRPLLQTLELTESMSNLFEVEKSRVQEIGCEDAHCCRKTLEMSQENTDLKRKLLRTRRALEETVTQLTLANQRKKQVEKSICKQIHKTSQVLRKAKANLDSGSETDAYKK